MTKLEALAKDCIENHTHKLVDKPTKQDIYLREESIFIQGYRQSEKKIEELEEENAELKARLNAINLLTPELEKRSKLRIQQLTIAKDLLLRFIELKNKPCAAGHSINMLLYENICANADQFLNSEVEK